MHRERNELNRNLAQMLKGGVIMDVTNPKEAAIAEEAGAVAVMALERVPSDIRKEGGVARMSDPKMIKEIQRAVSIPVMAKARIGHIAEAQILQALGVDYIDESEVLTPCLLYTSRGRSSRRFPRARCLTRSSTPPGPTGNLASSSSTA